MNEIDRRRTFAIISHPDAGKTTLTEKLLLYGGALHLAGTVTARKNRRSTASDWMDLEKKRGISISSTVLQFAYNDFRINLLDTPGHRDFSEDTYRVLTAVDAVVMVLDAGKGIESQTLKLFEVCRQRKIPIFTFMNKLDRPAKEPLELLDELEQTLKLQPFPFNWPLGTGTFFKGLYDRMEHKVHLFERTPHGAYKAPVAIQGLEDPLIRERLDPEHYSRVVEELEVLEHAGVAFDPMQVLSGEMTPVFFGSAMNNFGVQLLLDGFLAWAPPPQPRWAGGRKISPADPVFSAFIFKIQGNMDPKHRDRLAFMRVCSGKFERDMVVHRSGSGKKVKLAYVHRLFGQDRETIDEAWPGDVIGLVSHDDFRIGDTLAGDPSIQYSEIPRFPPEVFSYIHNPSPAKSKPFKKGLEQLLLEGVVQSFAVSLAAANAPLVAAVGPLQFEVLQYRLKEEYGVDTRLENAPWQLVRWIDADTAERLSAIVGLPPGTVLGQDAWGEAVCFFADPWALRYVSDRHPALVFHEMPLRDRAVLSHEAT
jgi:peptide chain release factor 3